MPKTASELYNDSRSFFEKMAASLNGLCDQLPDEAKAILNPLKAQLNETLSKMTPLDQVEAANQVNYALNSLGYALGRVHELSQSLMSSLNDLQKKFTAQTAALNGQIDEAIKDRVKQGVLVEKAAHDQAIQAVNEQHTRIDTRRGALAIAGLPGAIDADFLKADDTAWNATVKTATDRAKALKDKGIKLPDDKLAKVLYGSVDLYEMALLSAPAKTAAGDPLIGDPATENKRAYSGAC